MRRTSFALACTFLFATVALAQEAGNDAPSDAAAARVDLSLTRHRAADLGELLSRSPGLNVRRRGGLGSDLQLSLDGASGDAVRVLWNEEPLELAGYSQAVADLPSFQLSRVDVYRGGDVRVRVTMHVAQRELSPLASSGEDIRVRSPLHA